MTGSVPFDPPAAGCAGAFEAGGGGCCGFGPVLGCLFGTVPFKCGAGPGGCVCVLFGAELVEFVIGVS